jgi:hypothetical protein
MPRDDHPFAAVLTKFVGVQRLNEQVIRSRPRAEGPVPALLLSNAVVDSKNGKLDRPLALCFSVWFVGDRIKVEPREVEGFETPPPLSAERAPDGSMAPYIAGIRRCHCRTNSGGRLWNPLIVGVVDTGFDSDLRHNLAMHWWQCVRTQQSLFCEQGLELLQKLGAIQLSNEGR